MLFWVSLKDCMPLMTEKFEALGRETRPKQCYGLFERNEIAEYRKMRRGLEGKRLGLHFGQHFGHPSHQSLGISLCQISF